MASLGSKVLQVRSVEVAMVHKVKTYVRSSFDDPADARPGTLICDEEDIVEQQVVTGIALSRDEAQITLAPRRRQARRRRGDLRPARRSQHQRRHDHPGRLRRHDDDRHHLHRAERRVQARDGDPRGLHGASIGFASLTGAQDVVKVSAIGVGMRSHVGIAARAFRALADKGINIRAITTSEIKFSVLIDEAYAELAVRTLHSLYRARQGGLRSLWTTGRISPTAASLSGKPPPEPRHSLGLVRALAKFAGRLRLRARLRARGPAGSDRARRSPFPSCFWISDDPFRRALLIASLIAVLIAELLNTGDRKALRSRPPHARIPASRPPRTWARPRCCPPSRRARCCGA